MRSNRSGPLPSLIWSFAGSLDSTIRFDIEATEASSLPLAELCRVKSECLRLLGDYPLRIFVEARTFSLDLNGNAHVHAWRSSAFGLPGAQLPFVLVPVRLFFVFLLLKRNTRHHDHAQTVS